MIEQKRTLRHLGKSLISGRDWGFHLLLLVCSALSAHAQNVVINETMPANATAVAYSTGEYYDWIELYNSETFPVDLDDMSLTDDVSDLDKWSFPDVSLAPGGFLIIWLSGEEQLSSGADIHANFKLNASGESLYLVNSAQQIIDGVTFDSMPPDISIGRIDPMNSSLVYFVEVTPNSTNSPSYFDGIARSPTLSHGGGSLLGPVQVTHVLDNPLDIVSYTLDSSEPDENSPELPDVLTIDQNTILRLKVFRPGAIPSEVFTSSYLFADQLELPIMSLVSEQQNLFGASGIYTNYTSGLEVPVHVEFYEPGESLAFAIDMGVKIHAPDSRGQKSLRLYARSEYGDNLLEYPLFPLCPVSTFKGLVLRNAGNDGTELGRTHIRDPFVHRIYEMQDPENSTSAYRPTNVYINGDYWGIYNIRERQDEHWLEDHFDVAPDEVDFLEYDYAEPQHMKIITGNWNNWNELREFIINNEMSTDENYEVVEDWIDIENYIDYMAFEVFIGNQDWCNNNIKFWRPHSPGAKWKWVLWDTEYGLGSFNTFPVGQAEFDFFSMSLTWCGWGNGDYTWMFRSLMENTGFRARYLTRAQDLMNTTFKYDFLESEFLGLKQAIAGDIDEQHERWGSSMSAWNTQTNFALTFMEQRPFFVRHHMAQRFALDTMEKELTVTISEALAGEVKVNTVWLNTNTLGLQGQPFPWYGEYLVGQHIRLEATPHFGYVFSHWTGDIMSTDPILDFELSENISVEAVFDPVEENIAHLDSLYINELMSNNQSVYPDESGEYEDWFELYNGSSEPIDIAGLYLSDDSEIPFKFLVGEGQEDLTTISPYGHLVFFADAEPSEGLLHTNFGLDADGEELILTYRSSIEEAVTIDEITFGSLLEDQSIGRSSDGAYDWIPFAVPTPDSPNISSVSVVEYDASDAMDITIFPNPTSGFVHILNPSQENVEFMVLMDLNGRILNRMPFIETVDLTGMAEGMYVLQLHFDSTITSFKVIKQ